VLTVVVTSEEPTPATTTTGESLIDEIVRDGARRMLAAALEAEVAAYIAAHTDQLDDHGRRLVVRNGHARSRQVLTSPGAVEVHAPRVNDKRVEEVTGRRRRFASVILLTWRRKFPKIWLADPSGNVVGAMHATTTPNGDPPPVIGQVRAPAGGLSSGWDLPGATARVSQPARSFCKIRGRGVGSGRWCSSQG
jgi:hypothetical protein